MKDRMTERDNEKEVKVERLEMKNIEHLDMAELLQIQADLMSSLC